MNKTNKIEFQILQSIHIKTTMSLQKTIDLIYAGLNKARTQPQAEALYYENVKSLYNGLIYRENVKTREGVKALQNLINELQHKQPISRKLKWSFALHMAADQHAIKLGDNGLLTTDGTRDHVPLPQRCKKYGVVRGRLTDVYEFGGNSAQQILECLLIDDGLVSRKRRKTLLDPIYNYIGIGTSYHEKYGTVTVIILAEDIISLVTPGDQGNYYKRQTLPQGQVYTFDIQQEKQNERRQIMQERSSYMSQNTSFNQESSFHRPSSPQRAIYQNALRAQSNPSQQPGDSSSCEIF